MSNAGSSEHWITVTFKVWLLKSYSSLYCNLPRYSLDAAEAPVAIKIGKKMNKENQNFIISLF